MEQANQTETEQIYNDMTGKADEEQTQEPEEVEETEETTEQEQDEEKDEQAEEGQEQDEIVDDEQLEIEREIAEYASKIEKLDAKLAAHKAQHVEALKREQMKNVYYTDEQIERYLPHIESGTADEIKESIFKLTLEIPPRDIYGDPSPMNHAKQRYAVDHESVGREIGKKAFERVKNKIHGLRWW